MAREKLDNIYYLYLARYKSLAGQYAFQLFNLKIAVISVIGVNFDRAKPTASRYVSQYNLWLTHLLIHNVFPPPCPSSILGTFQL